jgi:two-component system LytT family response regulator
MLRETMSHLEAQLPHAFLRLSRSAIVNLRRVKDLRTAPSGEHFTVLADAQHIPFTRSLREVEARLRAL